MVRIPHHRKKEGEIKSNWFIPTMMPAKNVNTRENVTKRTTEQ